MTSAAEQDPRDAEVDRSAQPTRLHTVAGLLQAIEGLPVHLRAQAHERVAAALEQGSAAAARAALGLLALDLAPIVAAADLAPTVAPVDPAPIVAPGPHVVVLPELVPTAATA